MAPTRLRIVEVRFLDTDLKSPRTGEKEIIAGIIRHEPHLIEVGRLLSFTDLHSPPYPFQNIANRVGLLAAATWLQMHRK